MLLRGLVLTRNIPLLLAVAAMAISADVWSQQEAQSSTYFMAPLPVNPALAGSSGQANVRSISRIQWVGFEGAPTSQILTFDAPLHDKKGGAGLMLMQDATGARTTTDWRVSGAAHIKLSEETTLSAGLNGGVRQHAYGFSGLRAEDPSEALYQTAYREWSANIGAGFFLSTPSFYAGYSVPNVLVETNVDSLAGSGAQRHHYGMIGFNRKPKPGLVMQTNALVKATANAPLVVDLNVMWTWMDQIGAGFLFRAGESAGLVLQTRISRGWKGIYSMDFPYNRLLVQTLGSHEIGLIWVPRDHAVVNARHF